jgi:6,7-dimethyl-8-ribityllumazine synthase
MLESKRVLVVVAPFYRDIADMLTQGCVDRLVEAGVEATVTEVPGALELPIAIRIADEMEGYDGYVALGCVIRGETSHYETVSNESARGLMELGIGAGLAIGNGIVTVENMEQAQVRADPMRKNKGAGAADACIALMGMIGGDSARADRPDTFLPDSEHIQMADDGTDIRHV